tara:strand:- start:105 stop:713 length:609 start_codon:yes stop_codon:yes gene_type:complete
MSNFSCCKAIEIFDIDEKKTVTISEEEVKSVQNSRRIYDVTGRNYSEARKNGISTQEFFTGLLRFAVAGFEKQVRQSPELKEKVQRFWESVSPKITQVGLDAIESEDDRAAIAKFKKPYKQLSDAEKETLEGVLSDQHSLDTIVYCLLSRALDASTPKWWRLDAVANKIAEIEKAEDEKEKAIAEKEKAKAEKRVPVGGEAD